MLRSPSLGYNPSVRPLPFRVPCAKARAILSAPFPLGCSFSSFNMAHVLVEIPPFDIFFLYFSASTVALWFNFLPLRRGEARKTRSGSVELELDHIQSTLFHFYITLRVNSSYFSVYKTRKHHVESEHIEDFFFFNKRQVSH